MISKEKKTAIIKEYARTEGDTGSPEVQVAVLTARIQDYLKKTDIERYRTLIDRLGIRK